MIHIHPGWYEIGREDGTIVPVLVRVDSCGGGIFHFAACSPRARVYAEEALNCDGWWWRRIAVPPTLPIALDEQERAWWTIPLPPPPD